MRRLACPIAGALLAFWALTCSGCAGPHVALDPVKLDPGRYKVLFENERVRVLEMRDRPGDVTVMHSHPQHLVYVFSAARRKFTFPDGTTKAADVKAGQVLWGEALTHAEQNVGAADTHVLIVELRK